MKSKKEILKHIDRLIKKEANMVQMINENKDSSIHPEVLRNQRHTRLVLQWVIEK